MECKKSKDVLPRMRQPTKLAITYESGHAKSMRGCRNRKFDRSFVPSKRPTGNGELVSFFGLVHLFFGTKVTGAGSELQWWYSVGGKLQAAACDG